MITQLAPIDVEFAVPQDRVPEIQARLRRRRDAAGQGARPHAQRRMLDTGRFSTLDNLVDTQHRHREGARRASPTPTATLFPNQFVNVQLLLRTIADAVVVPVTALRHGANGDFVYVLERRPHGVAAHRSSAARPTRRRWSRSSSGLEAGERVVTEGGDRLKDGARVQLPGDRPARPRARRAARRALGPRGARAAANAAPAPAPSAARVDGDAAQKRRR